METKEVQVSRRSVYLRWASVVVVVGVIALCHIGVVVPTTPSIKYHVLLETTGTPHKGDYVNVDVYHSKIDAEHAVTLTKRIACAAGDVLRFEDGRHYCNGEYLGTALKRTSEGLPLTAFEFNGQIPDGKVFLVGDHERSFDSRYLGLVNADALQLLTPLF